MFNKLFGSIFGKKNDNDYDDNYDNDDPSNLYQRNLKFAEKVAKKLNLQEVEEKMFIDGIDFNFNTRSNTTSNTVDDGIITYVLGEAHARGDDLDYDTCIGMLKDIEKDLGINR